MPVLVPCGPCMPSSEPFLPSSELEEVVFDENWYFLFTVMGMLQLSRYLGNINRLNQRMHILHRRSFNNFSWSQTGLT